ncbi:hypothetical protein, partial [Vibrio campbellii]
FTFGEANYNSLPCCSKNTHERSTHPSDIEKAAHFGSVLEAASRHEKPQKNRKKTLNIFCGVD